MRKLCGFIKEITLYFKNADNNLGARQLNNFSNLVIKLADQYMSTSEIIKARNEKKKRIKTSKPTLKEKSFNREIVA